MKIRNYLEDPGCNPPKEIEKYLNSSCEIFAVAANRIFNWDIMAITEIRMLNGLVLGKALVHAFLTLPDDSDNIFDAKGTRSNLELEDDYPLHPDVSFDFISEKDLIELVHKPSDPDYKPITYEELEKQIKEAEDFINKYYLNFKGK